MNQAFAIFRAPNTDSKGRDFDVHQVATVWLKALPVLGHDPAIIRQDSCGALIAFFEYGKAGSDVGWEIDHVLPVALGGNDLLVNLQPLHWRNNRHKSDSYPSWLCAVSARR